MTSSRTSPWETIHRRINQRQMIVQSLSKINNAFPQLFSVKSCAMLGCGSGQLDLEFVSRYLPNVEKLTAVEPDADQMAAFKTRVAQLLPDVINLLSGDGPELERCRSAVRRRAAVPLFVLHPTVGAPRAVQETLR